MFWQILFIPYLKRGRKEIPFLPGSIFAPESHRNVCYACRRKMMMLTNCQDNNEDDGTDVNDADEQGAFDDHNSDK